MGNKMYKTAGKTLQRSFSEATAICSTQLQKTETRGEQLGEPCHLPQTQRQETGRQMYKRPVGRTPPPKNLSGDESHLVPERTEDKHLKFVPRPALTMAEDPKAKWGTAVEIFEHLATFFRLEGRSEIS